MINNPKGFGREQSLLGVKAMLRLPQCRYGPDSNCDKYIALQVLRL